MCNYGHHPKNQIAEGGNWGQHMHNMGELSCPTSIFPSDLSALAKYTCLHCHSRITNLPKNISTSHRKTLLNAHIIDVINELENQKN